MVSYTIKSGDTFTTIAAQFNTTVQAIEAANPGVNPTTLQIGQVINIGSSATSTNYTIKAGDTFSAIAKSLNVDVSSIQNLNPGVDPTKLQVGQVIKVPASGSKPPTAPAPTPAPAPAPAPTPSQPSTGKYIIVGGDTFTIIAAKYGTDVATIQNLNPGVNPTTLQIGQVINVPNKAAQPTQPTQPSPGVPTGNGGLVFYSGPASSFPNPSSWASYNTLWAQNSKLMKYSDSDAEITFIGNAISQVARESGMDARVILCMIMQETGGNVRAQTTTSPAPDFIRNTGLMQAHDGATFDPGNAVGSITQMIRDGAAGTSKGDGLKQCYARYGNYYEALRAYNSGSVDRSNLSNGITATGDYVSKMANRLLGHTWTNM